MVQKRAFKLTRHKSYIPYTEEIEHITVKIISQV